MSLLTVVTVVKDDPSGLRLTLESLDRQVACDSAVLILDGSADRQATAALLGEFPGLNARLEWRPPSGVYGAMNDALSLVDSAYVYFLNAGDALASDDVLPRVTDALAEHRPVWAFGRVRFLSESGTPLREPGWSYERERARLFARGVFPAHQGVVASARALREQGGFDSRFRIVADYASILRLSLESSPLELGFALAIFRQGGLSSQQWRQSLREFHEARLLVYAPTGVAALRERLDTWRLQARTRAFHALTGLRRDRAAGDDGTTRG